MGYYKISQDVISKSGDNIMSVTIKTHRVKELSWTTTPPTEPGWFWVEYPDGEIACIDIFFSGGRLETSSEYNLDSPVYWLGPVPVPESPKKGGE